MIDTIEWAIEVDEDGRAYVRFIGQRCRVAIARVAEDAGLPTRGVTFVQVKP